MSKTPEQMAEEYVQWAIQPHMPDEDGECCVRNYDVWSSLPNGDRVQMIFTGPPIKDAFLAGYKAAQQWISVKDRLPEQKLVLVVMPKKTITLGICYEKTQKFDVFLNRAIVTAEPTHWQPLPAPPKEEE